MIFRYALILVLGIALIGPAVRSPEAWGQTSSPAGSTGIFSGRVHLAVGANAAAFYTRAATVHGGVVVRDFARIAHRPLHARIIVEHDVFDHETVAPVSRRSIIHPPVVSISSMKGLSLESALLYGLRSLRRTNAPYPMTPYAGVTAGFYRRVIEQQVFKTASSEDAAVVIPIERPGPRVRPTAGLLLGLIVPVPAEKAPFYASAVTLEGRYRYLFGDTDLPRAIRQSHQLAALIGLAWRLW